MVEVFGVIGKEIESPPYYHSHHVIGVSSIFPYVDLVQIHCDQETIFIDKLMG